MAGYTQLIDKPTHVFSGGSSCIDLMFCNKSGIFSECGIYHSLFVTCHHNLTFANISANVSLPLIMAEKFGLQNCQCWRNTKVHISY